LSSPRIIFFDAAGTLLHLPRGAAWHYLDVARRHGWKTDEPRLAKAFGRAFRELPPPITTRAPRPDDDRAWWQALVWRVLDDCDAPASFGRGAYFHELYHEFTLPGIWELYPEAREVLEALRPRYRLGLISNFDGRLREVLRHLEIAELFEVIAISSEIGADKPDPFAFERALQLAGVTPSEALHVGDDPECDWQAAAAAGLQVFPLDRPKNDLRALLPILLAKG
jgi:putative hydrolase of the HAD superfamily